MLATVVRSGMVESWHEGAVAVVDDAGQLIAHSGDLGRTFFIRSASKPFQATISQELGAGLNQPALAVACSSHDGHPVQVAYVTSMLTQAGLGESNLGCPPDRPLSSAADRRLLAAGQRQPSRLLHNCSGKHAAMLRACVAQGWPLESYLEPNHPLQVAITAFLQEVTGEKVEPVGTDGCGAPVHRVTVVGMARAFSQLAVSTRLRPALEAMHNYPRLTSGMRHLDADIGIWFDGAAKRGAEGNIGVALRGRLGLAAKSWDGSGRGVNVAVVEAFRQLGVLSSTAPGALDGHAQPLVLGGGREVGRVVPVLQLKIP